MTLSSSLMRFTRTRLKQSGDERAQGLIEFAILVPILLLVFLGTVDFGRFLYYQVSIQNAARVGAETAINHCYDRYDCAQSSTPTSDDWIMQATVCEAGPYVNLSPSITCGLPALTTSGGSCTTTTPCVSDPCSTSCTPCQKDVCVSPSGTRTNGEDVTVSVGYSFHPITPLMGAFFNEHSCYTGDSVSTNHHTLCASSTGKVS